MSKNNKNNNTNSNRNNMVQGTMLVDSEERTITIQKNILVNGVLKTGVFVGKYLSLMERIKIGSIRAKLLDGAPAESLDPYTDNIVFMVAYLTVALVKQPSWFKLEELDDITILQQLYNEIDEFNQSFRLNYESSKNGATGSTTIHEKNMVGNENISSTN